MVRSGLCIASGLVDMHVHFREPGFEYKEDIHTGALAAAAGGVTTCCCMPNTNPVADCPEIIRFISDKSKSAPVRILPVGAITVGQKGETLTNFKALKDAGAIALSDDGYPVADAELMREAMLLAREHDILLICHCEEEESMVARDVELARETSAKIHIAHVSTKSAVDTIRRAKSEGVNVTAEACPQHFTLTEDDVPKLGSLARVNPPLRTKSDVLAIIDGLCDGTIDAIATDHAPHSVAEKSLPFDHAPPGMIGLETSLALALTVLSDRLSFSDIINLMSANPARILGIEHNNDFVIFDPNEEWVVDLESFESKARNSPFGGMRLSGRVKYTIACGKIVYECS